ncbi:DarT ssDNA thymidine ADP-ribosyltransferase family protein [Usitatibacter palustris]|uniref:DarT domain-containing protein n=1 Tax=Usitatibacter palustris TaxID=2732487 RepID=A0A6M4H525_9PROT|nr:hypothetical protein DSM104440_01561 [Usitatibacter palustris]
MSVGKVVAERAIRDLLHFTTSKGLLGILQSRALRARARLGRDQQLEYIFSPNAAFRKDEAWLDYVNLSVSWINHAFFAIAAEKWHKGKDIWWCILAFPADLMNDEDVYFTTTNNMYSGVSRARGEAGLSGMFAPSIVQWRGRVVTRPLRLPASFTTCSQAEVLYRGEVPTTRLLRVYVATEEHADEVEGMRAVTQHAPIEVVVDPSLFEPRKV